MVVGVQQQRNTVLNIAQRVEAGKQRPTADFGLLEQAHHTIAFGFIAQVVIGRVVNPLQPLIAANIQGLLHLVGDFLTVGGVLRPLDQMIKHLGQ